MQVVSFHTQHPNQRDINLIAKAISDGKIVIFPTDSVYALGCNLSNKAAIERIIQITGKEEKKSKLSLLCDSLKTASEHTLPFSNDVFKTMKQYLPGPFTFILNANNKVTKYFKNNKKEIGIRIPDNEVIQKLIQAVGEPIISTSLPNNDDINMNDPIALEEIYRNKVDFLIDCGELEGGFTTILNCTTNEILIEREGKGII